MNQLSVIHNEKTCRFSALEDGDEAGYLEYCFPKDESNDTVKRNIQIDYLYVKDSYRRKGIGMLLMQEVIDFAKNSKLVWISLWTGKEIEMKGACSIYTKAGFIQKAMQEDYYDDQIATRLFIKRIN